MESNDFEQKQQMLSVFKNLFK